MPQDLSGAQTGMAPSNDINNPRPDNKRGLNEFPQSYDHLTTDRYGEYSPFFWAKCERGDIQNLNCRHDLHTFTLKSPMKSKVVMTKSFIKVPMEAIYPRNWERMLTIPVNGDDVPNDVRALFDPTLLLDRTKTALGFVNLSYRLALKYWVLLEALASNGSLFAKFNMHLAYRFNMSIYDSDGELIEIENMSIDKILDRYIYPIFIEFAKSYPIYDSTGKQFIVSTDPSAESASDNLISPRRFLEMVRRNDVTFAEAWDETFFVNGSISANNPFSYVGYRVTDVKHYLNIEPIIAYQLACAQFATNDHIDFVYSAKIYRDNMQAIFYNDGARQIPSFLYNGVVYQYDVFSNRFFNTITAIFNESTVDFFLNLFSFVPSLRYGDYFVGGRSQPLAVGEYSVDVVDGSVSTIDIVRNIQLTRLGHHANMVGPKKDDYLAGIFGGPLPQADKDVPIFLAHQHFEISGFETENTGDAQLTRDQSITSHLRSAENRHSFEIEIAEPCYIIGMNSYTATRIYTKTMDRFAFHHDRYDDFIPEQQYIGDQDIKLVELDSTTNSHVPFAYATRYMEYKQRASYASGGFIEFLPSWAFITDNTDGNPSGNHISPDYIRSSPSEFDRFYLALSGYSLASYFHFIVAHDNGTAPSRMMEYSPEILR